MNRRNFLGILAAAPAAALVPKLSAEGKESIVNKSLVPVFQTALNPPRSRNLSMEELHQAFLNKWIPTGRQRRNYPHGNYCQ